MAILRHIKIENFRGIQFMDWHVKGRIICLVGPGDSCKTTILDAIELALFPSSFTKFADTDFFQADTSNLILVDLTIGEVPEEFLAEDKFGLFLRGYNVTTGIHEDPDDTCEPVLTIRLQVSPDLEAQWTCIKPTNPEPKLIGHRDRNNLGVARLGDDVERHLTWGRGSDLLRLTKTDLAAKAVAIAHRSAQGAVANATLTDLQSVATLIQKTAGGFGISLSTLRPGLDLGAITYGQTAISLHENNIPLRAAGLGTKRLAALAVQQTDLGAKSIILIDEIEHGLEPHRIRLALNKICGDHSRTSETLIPEGQVIMTTHSPTPILHLDIADIRFVKNEKGKVTVLKVEDSATELLQRIARRIPQAFLSKRIIVCEGKTEVGLCRALDDVWRIGHGNLPMAYFGVTSVVGDGTDASKKALGLGNLGYSVLYFGDSDRTIDPDETTLGNSGVEVVLWPGQYSTEERVAQDLPLEQLQALLNAAITDHGAQKIEQTFKPFCNTYKAGLKLHAMLSAGGSESEVRGAIGKAAKNGGWFKSESEGMVLGGIVAEALPAIASTPLAATLARLEGWIYSA